MYPPERVVLVLKEGGQITHTLYPFTLWLGRFLLAGDLRGPMLRGKSCRASCFVMPGVVEANWPKSEGCALARASGGHSRRLASSRSPLAV